MLNTYSFERHRSDDIENEKWMRSSPFFLWAYCKLGNIGGVMLGDQNPLFLGAYCYLLPICCRGNAIGCYCRTLRLMATFVSRREENCKLSLHAQDPLHKTRPFSECILCWVINQGNCWVVAWVDHFEQHNQHISIEWSSCPFSNRSQYYLVNAGSCRGQLGSCRTFTCLSGLLLQLPTAANCRLQNTADYCRLTN